MIRQANIKEFLESEHPVLDVRSPGEFEAGHIIQALNLPLLNDKHRHLVGMCYKKKGKEAAITLGYQLVDPLRESILEQATLLGPGGKVRMYCARGGLRSNKMAEFLDMKGYEVTVLKGGYKAYRNHVLGLIRSFRHIILLSGHTGSGKTEVLQELRKLGCQVLDLEGLANHKGSAFGALGNNEQPVSGQFHNMIFQILRNYHPEKPLWIENENITIGKVCLPNELWENMLTAKGYEIVLPVEERVAFILKHYGHFDRLSLVRCVNSLSKRLGDEDCRKLCSLIEEGDLAPVVERLFSYYDKAYEHGREKRKCQEFVKLQFDKLNPVEIAGFLLSRAGKV
jgi:tRNA 2-selenouridine synthase